MTETLNDQGRGVTPAMQRHIRRCDRERTHMEFFGTTRWKKTNYYKNFARKEQQVERLIK